MSLATELVMTASRIQSPFYHTFEVHSAVNRHTLAAFGFIDGGLGVSYLDPYTSNTASTAGFRIRNSRTVVPPLFRSISIVSARGT